MRAGLKPNPLSDRSPGRVERLAGLAKKALRVGRAAEAMQHYRAILDVEPGHVDANYQLGRAALEPGSYARQAIPLLFAALKAAPGEERHWLAAIVPLTMSGQVERRAP
jgi:tetratricopeptide (TPR) repeat protein